MTLKREPLTPFGEKTINHLIIACFFVVVASEVLVAVVEVDIVVFVLKYVVLDENVAVVRCWSRYTASKIP